MWERVQDTFSSKIVSPHFEDLARDWTIRYAREVGINDIGPTGTTVVACKEHRGHEVDVLALDRGSRLEHIRDLLAHLGWNVTDASFALFSRYGFTTELSHVALNPGNRPSKLHLLNLDSMYAS
ncbi:MAG: hypothetical protein DLM55_10460 [Acidimicrobiales bacterium]|nr:MAG: hypothetical protein DLM55_10460 [Acidimicrobiales bacterium]